MRKHDSLCQCDECWAADLLDKYPDIKVLQRYSAKEVADIWINYSERDCAGWLKDDRISIFQVFYQAPVFIAQGKPENFNWRTGKYFNINEIDKLIQKYVQKVG